MVGREIGDSVRVVSLITTRRKVIFLGCILRPNHRPYQLLCRNLHQTINYTSERKKKKKRRNPDEVKKKERRKVRRMRLGYLPSGGEEANPWLSLSHNVDKIQASSSLSSLFLYRSLALPLNRELGTNQFLSDFSLAFYHNPRQIKSWGLFLFLFLIFVGLKIHPLII
jgi:hypothetical protein